MKKTTLSIVISAYNEEKNIEECLNSVKWADEIIVIDNESADKTVTIAQQFTKKIFIKQNNIMLNKNKNFGFSKATGDWILSIDADERVSEDLQKEISTLLNRESESVAYWIPRKNIIFGKWIQSDMWWPDYQLRLFKNGKGKFPEKHVHEYLHVEGSTEKLSHPLIHKNYSTINQFLYKMENIYTESEVKSRLEKNVHIEWTDALGYPIQDFLKTFFLQKGYKDGLHGLVLSILQAFYMEIVFIKLWEKEGFKEEMPKNFLKQLDKEFKNIYKQFRYWFLTAFMEEANPIKKVSLKVLRKIKNT